MLKKIIFVLVACAGLLGGAVEIASQTWHNTEIPYTIVHNIYTPRFRPQVFIKDLVEKALDEFRLPGITLNVTYANTIYKGSSSGSIPMDGINSISFHPSYTPASTSFYQRSTVEILEFDMKFNSNAYKTAETLYLSILHEFGHVFGLAHPLEKVDTIMGRGLIRKPDGTYVQEHTYFSLAKDDVIALYKHEAVFRTFREHERTYLNTYLWSLISSYTTTLQEQELQKLCAMSTMNSEVTYREQDLNEEEYLTLPLT